MMDIRKQIESGCLVCPTTKQPLSVIEDNQWLENADRTKRYKLLGGRVPVLLADTEWAEQYAADSKRMSNEYDADSVRRSGTLLRRIKGRLTQDYRTPESKEALARLLRDLTNVALCISIGGGPSRVHPRVTTVNIGPFPNVDVVADAHRLPYSDNSVDAIHCEAVFEHLYDPNEAASEMFRVLKSGCRAYVCTPFLQAYHGYPHHYQNYTLTGHERMFESAGFCVVESGSCVGPVYTIVNLGAVFLNEYLPFPLNKILRVGWSAIGVLIRPLDKIVGRKKNAYVMASTTYLIIEKMG